MNYFYLKIKNLKSFYMKEQFIAIDKVLNLFEKW